MECIKKFWFRSDPLMSVHIGLDWADIPPNTKACPFTDVKNSPFLFGANHFNLLKCKGYVKTKLPGAAAVPDLDC